jgi:hypothetical protein
VPHDDDIESLLARRLEQEHRFTKLEGRVTSLEACQSDIKDSVKTVSSNVAEVANMVQAAKDALGKWALGVIVALGVFTLGLIVTLVKLSASVPG